MKPLDAEVQAIAFSGDLAIVLLQGAIFVKLWLAFHPTTARHGPIAGCWSQIPKAGIATRPSTPWTTPSCSPTAPVTSRSAAAPAAPASGAWASTGSASHRGTCPARSSPPRLRRNGKPNDSTGVMDNPRGGTLMADARWCRIQNGLS